MPEEEEIKDEPYLCSGNFLCCWEVFEEKTYWKNICKAYSIYFVGIFYTLGDSRKEKHKKY